VSKFIFFQQDILGNRTSSEGRARERGHLAGGAGGFEVVRKRGGGLGTCYKGTLKSGNRGKVLAGSKEGDISHVSTQKKKKDWGLNDSEVANGMGK